MDDSSESEKEKGSGDEDEDEVSDKMFSEESVVNNSDKHLKMKCFSKIRY